MRIDIQYLKEHEPHLVRELHAEGARMARESEERKRPKGDVEAMSEEEALRVLMDHDPHVAETFRRATAAQRKNILALFQKVREGAPDADQELRQEATSIQTSTILSAGRRARDPGQREASEEDPESSAQEQAQRILDAGRKR